MEDLALFGFLLRLVYASIGLLAVFGTLILFNKATGSRFDAAYEKMAAEAGMPFAVYRGLLVLGVLLFYARVLS